LGLKTKLKEAYGQFSPAALVSKKHDMLFCKENYDFIFYTNVTGRNYVDGRDDGIKDSSSCVLLHSPFQFRLASVN
jgi:hypothetical protein